MSNVGRVLTLVVEITDDKGKRIRAVMASRFGDVGITEDLTAERGYSSRVAVEELSNFSDKG